MATLTLRSGTSSSFSVLLSRYMSGEITDNTWSRLMSLFDTDGVESTERIAFARFVNDLVAEGGPQALYMPKEEEVMDLLSETRH